MVTRYCPDCHKKLPDGSRTRRRCSECQRKRTRRQEKEYKQRTRGVGRAERAESRGSGKTCPFAGNCVDIQGLDAFLRRKIKGPGRLQRIVLMPAATTEPHARA